MKRIVTLLLLVVTTIISAQNYKFGKVSKEELQEKFYPEDSTTNAVCLYKYRKTYFDYKGSDGFVVINEYHERIKIYSEEGFDRATIEMPYYNESKGSKQVIKSIKAYTYNLVNGKVKKEKVSGKDVFDIKRNKFYSYKKITMPNVKNGTVIEFSYKKTSPYYSIEDLNFQDNIPIKKVNYIIELPEYFRYNKLTKGYMSITPKIEKEERSFEYRIDAPVISQGGSRTSGETRKSSFIAEVSTFLGDNIPALKDDEPYVANVNSYRGGLKYELTSIQMPNSIARNYSTSWDKVTKEIYLNQSFGGELKKKNYYKDDLATVLSNTNNDIEKIIAIYQFVKSKVKWDKIYGKYSTGVRKAYKEGAGSSADINLMLTSMLQSANLNAAPVLVSSRQNGIPLFPTNNGFNYVISIVYVGNSYLLLDATEKYGEPNVLPIRALNWNGRVVRKDGSSSWVPLVSSKPATEDHIVNAKINYEEGMVEGTIRSKYGNLNALNFRNRYNNVKEESLRSIIEKDYNIEVENFRITNQFKLGKPVTRMVKFVSEDLLEEINGKLYISPLLFFTRNVNPFKAEERKYPIDFSSPWKDNYAISLAIPEGYKVETLPKDFALGLSEGIGVFKFQAKHTGNKINIMCITQFNESKINPTYYKELKDFYKKIVETQAEKIVLVKS